MWNRHSLFARIALTAMLVALASPQEAHAQTGYGRGGYGYSNGYGGGNQPGYGAGNGQSGGYGGGYGSGYGAAGYGGGGYGAGNGGMGGYGQGGGYGASTMGGGYGGQGGSLGQGGAFGGGMGGRGGMGGAYVQQRGGAQRNFVGRDGSEVQAGFQQQFGGQQPGQFFAGMIQNFNEMRDARRRWREQQNAPPPIQVQLRAGPELVAAVGASHAQGSVQTRLAEMLAVHALGTAEVTMTPEATVLTGVVASEHDRALIARLVSLEPGVGPIDNRLIVSAPAALPTASNP